MTYTYKMILQERVQKLYEVFDFLCECEQTDRIKIKLSKVVNLINRINNLNIY